MNLVDGNGTPLNKKPQGLVDATGEKLQVPVKEDPATTKEIGQNIATNMITKASKAPTNALVNAQFDILYHVALNLLSHRITNVGLGFEEANAVVEWNPSRAFACEKEVQEHLSLTVDEWKNQFLNGELVFTPGKPT